MTSPDVAAYARAYLRGGLSVFPLDPDSKRPFGAENNRPAKWQRFQSGRMSLNEADIVFKPLHDGRVPNIAIICGAVSGNLAVVDLDNAEAVRAFLAAYPDTLSRTKVARTGKGIHVYTRTDEPMRKGYMVVPGKFDEHGQPVRLGIDLQAEESYVVAPPSLHPSGARYRWVNPDVKGIGRYTVAEIRDIAERLGGKWTQATRGTAAGGHERGSERHPMGWISKLLLAGPGLHDGDGRNRSLTSLMGYFRSRVPYDIGYAIAELWNNSCADPQDEDDVRTIVSSVYRYNTPAEHEEPDGYEDLPV